MYELLVPVTLFRSLLCNIFMKKVNTKVQGVPQPQPTPDTKRKRKGTEINAGKINKQLHEKHIDQLSLPRVVIPMLNRTENNNRRTKSKAGLSQMSHVMRKPVLALCKQQRCRSACASAVSISKISRL